MAVRERLHIAVDAMGGDNAPLDIVRGAVAFVREVDHPLFLVGRRSELDTAVRTTWWKDGVSRADRARVARLITIVEADEVIGSDEHPANAVRVKKDSSLVRACELVASGDAGSVVSAGNSGAMLAAALFAIKRIDGVSRPAIGTVFPSKGGRSFLLDAGANTDCKAQWLAQFAVMGNVYAQTMLDIAEPRIGLLSNGEEAKNGSRLILDARPLIEALPLSFVGNVEGRDLFNGTCDVAVSDGFTGNVVLKTAEGAAEFLFGELRHRAEGSVRGKIGGALLKKALRPLRDQADYRHTGGALLLGVRGEAVIAHGRSDPLATSNAIKVAHRAARSDVSGTIAHAIAASAAAVRAAPVTSPMVAAPPDTKEHRE